MRRASVLQRAESRLAVMESHLDATRERLRALDAERARFEKILALLDAATHAPMIAEYHFHLTALDGEREALRARADEKTPQRARAEAGVRMLEALREGRMLTRVEQDGAPTTSPASHAPICWP